MSHSALYVCGWSVQVSGFNAFVIACDSTQVQSFRNSTKYLEILERSGGSNLQDTPSCLALTKSDLYSRQAVPMDEVSALCNRHNMQLFQTSAVEY